MPTHSEAVRLNLEYYRKQAKARLKASRQADPGSPIKLADAQFAIARENGFASWTRFRDFIVRSKLDVHGLVSEFVKASISAPGRAEEILREQPEIASAGLYPALVLGDAARLEQLLAETPDLTKTKGGPRGWEPLLYVCFSRFGDQSRLAQTGKLLLRHGADPNASFITESWPDSPLSCLYGATGATNNAELALALLEAGANPNDGESLYHSTEHHDLKCVRVLLEHGATPRGSNALKHMLDREDAEGVRLLLEAGADPNERNARGDTALHWAVWRGRSEAILMMLLDAGALIDAQRSDGRTAYAMAVLTGQTQIAAFLESRGASREIPAITATDAHLLPELASVNGLQGVRMLLEAGAPLDTRGDHGATALHFACWQGYGEMAELLLRHGASLTIEDEQFHGTPVGW